MYVSSTSIIGSSGVCFYLSPVEDPDLDEAARFLLIVQDAVGGEAPVTVVVKLDASR